MVFSTKAIVGGLLFLAAAGSAVGIGLNSGKFSSSTSTEESSSSSTFLRNKGTFSSGAINPPRPGFHGSVPSPEIGNRVRQIQVEMRQELEHTGRLQHGSPGSATGRSSISIEEHETHSSLSSSRR